MNGNINDIHEEKGVERFGVTKGDRVVVENTSLRIQIITKLTQI